MWNGYYSLGYYLPKRKPISAYALCSLCHISFLSHMGHLDKFGETLGQAIAYIHGKGFQLDQVVALTVLLCYRTVSHAVYIHSK